MQPLASEGDRATLLNPGAEKDDQFLMNVFAIDESDPNLMWERKIRRKGDSTTVGMRFIDGRVDNIVNECEWTKK